MGKELLCQAQLRQNPIPAESKLQRSPRSDTGKGAGQ